MPPRPVRQSAAQRTRIATANRINKGYRWETSRQNIRPRGLMNNGNNCYRIGVIQTLLHLPRFVNWILEHRERGKHWQCLPTDQNLQQPKSDKDSFEMRPHATGCVPCLLRALIQAYWGVYKLTPPDVGEPQRLEQDDPAIIGLHRLAERWFCRNPDGWSNTLSAIDNARKNNNKKRPMTLKERDDKTKSARKDQEVGQQDADEFMRFIFDGIEQSYAPTQVQPLMMPCLGFRILELTFVQRHSAWTIPKKAIRFPLHLDASRIPHLQRVQRAILLARHP